MKKRHALLFSTLLLLLMISSPSFAQAFFFNAGFDNSVPRVNVTNQGEYAPICSTPGLPGLDKVRAYFDLLHCPSTNTESRLSGIEIDALFLIDDTQPLSDYMTNALREQDMIRQYRGRPVVKSGVRNFTQEGEYSNLNVLVVGEMDYQALGSEDAWWEKMVVATGFSLSAEECALSSDDQAVISSFAQRTIDMNQNMRTVMLSALGDFETDMSFESTYNATPRVGNAIAKEAIDQAKGFIIGKIAGQVPGFDVIVAFADAASDEIERAQQASSSQRMSVWISRARTIFTDCLGTLSCGADGNDQVQEIDLEYLTSQINEDICSLPENRRPAARQRLLDASNNLNSSRPSIHLLKKGIYESWIRAHYQSTPLVTDSAQGTIELVWEVEEDGGVLSFNGNSYVAKVVVEEYGDDAEDGMNTIINRVRSVSTPLDFKVNKKICFIVDNVMPGGRSRECALLDEQNRIIHRTGGSTGMASRAFQSDVWRSRTTSFRRN